MHFNNRLHTVHISSLRTISKLCQIDIEVAHSKSLFDFLEDLKDAIVEKTSIPVCRQLIKGWPKPRHKEAQVDSTVLKTLHLARENNVFLTDLTQEGFVDNDVVFVSAEPAMPPMFQLRIRYTNENKELNLNFPASKTLLEIKNDIYAVLKVPVRHQQWVGWPTNAHNSMKLSEIGLPAIHNLTLSGPAENNFNRDV